MKRIVRLLLIVILISCVTGCTVKSSEDIGDNDNTISNEEITDKTIHHLTEVPDNYIGIYTVDDLINSDYNRDANYILMNDLDLSSIDDWEGISNDAIFDGNNYTVSNIKSTQIGLFDIANIVCNLSIENIEIKISNSNNLLGGVSKKANHIENCSVKGKYLICSELMNGSGSVVIGGICGIIRESINNCNSNVDINAYNDGEVISSYCIGGIVGIADDNSLIEFCEFNGNIISWGSLGGICSGSYGSVKISGCSNNGQIIVSTDALGSSRVGGIAGTPFNITIENCANNANIICKDNFLGSYYGGIIGYCSNEVNMKNCFNTGIINANKENNIGAIIGSDFVSNINISNCAYLSSNYSISSSNAMYPNCKAMTESEMKDKKNYPFDNIDKWENINNSYPKYIRQ